jgi:hypothetical protein
VSIDEQRSDFLPTLWSAKDGSDVEQVWFAGVHADVGGGYAHVNGVALSDIPLAWMAQEAARVGLQFETHLYDKQGLDPLARLHRSHKRFWRVLGKSRRTIPDGAIMHRSVKQRFDAGGYAPAPLLCWLDRREGDWGPVAR